jgi:hypothetical protein
LENHVFVFYYLSYEGRLNELDSFLKKWEFQIIMQLESYKKQINSSDKLNEIETIVHMIKNKGGLSNYTFM